MTGHPGKGSARTSRSRRGLVASAVLLAVIVLAAGIAAATKRTGTDTDNADGDSAGSVPSSLAATSAPPRTAAANGFALPEVDQYGRRVDIPAEPAGQLRAQTVPPRTSSDPSWLTAAPAGLAEPGGWQRVHGAVVPFSTSDGPTSIRNGIAGGYARTPQGAALAAAMTVYQVLARPGDRAVLAARLVLTDTDRARFESGIAAGTLPVQQPISVTRTLIAHDGFRIDSYAEDLAVVRLAVRTPTSGQATEWVSTRVPMVWVDGDWRLRSTGEQVAAETVSNLSGWTRWA